MLVSVKADENWFSKLLVQAERSSTNRTITLDQSNYPLDPIFSHLTSLKVPNLTRHLGQRPNQFRYTKKYSKVLKTRQFPQPLKGFTPNHFKNHSKTIQSIKISLLNSCTNNSEILNSNWNKSKTFPTLLRSFKHHSHQPNMFISLIPTKEAINTHKCHSNYHSYRTCDKEFKVFVKNLITTKTCPTQL